jgi:WD40-like Beta Propeller Repeat
MLAGGVSFAVAGPVFGHTGELAGQVDGSNGIAIDRASGDIYVSDSFNDRISKFDGSGKFLFAWGGGVLNGADEPQTCTTSCQKGHETENANQGEVGEPLGVAVDNDPASPSHGDIYVLENGRYRVQKFDSSGKFLLAFGGHVNEKTGADVCVAGEECRNGTPGALHGELESEGNGAYVAVGPGGAVYVGDKGRVDVFEPTGAWREDISLAGMSSTARVGALAVDATGDVYVAEEEVSGVPGVHEFEPGGLEKVVQFDAGSEYIKAISLDEAGDVFVSDSTGGIHFLEYSPTGQELATFGSNTLTRAEGALAFDEALKSLIVFGSNEQESEAGRGVWEFTVPSPGPLVELGSEHATPELLDKATVHATVNPEGSETTYHFEYVDQTHFQESAYAGALSTAATLIGTGFEDQAASAQLAGLRAGVTYHYRVVASNANGTVAGPDQTFTKAVVEGPWTTNVASTSATFSAMVDPLGASTEYRFEYGTSVTYGQVLSGGAGAGASYMLASQHGQGLQPATLYHYRIVTVSALGTYESPDRTFTTQPVGNQELTLPDGRAWELVSPPDKQGSLIEIPITGLIQAADDGKGISYISNGPVGEGVVGSPAASQIYSARGADGWKSQDISLPHVLNPNLPKETEYLRNEEYRLFSSDLSLALVQPYDHTQLSSEAKPGEVTLYIRNDENSSFSALVNEANVLPGIRFGNSKNNDRLQFLDATPDLSHVIFSSPMGLIPGAPEPCHEDPATEACTVESSEFSSNLYEWNAGELQLVNVLPDGKPSERGPFEVSNAYLGQDSVMTANAVSADGRRIVWQHFSNGSQGSGLYLRDMVEKKTVQLGGSLARFQTMSSDGSTVFFTERGELYSFDWDNGTQTDVTAVHGAGEESAGVLGQVTASQDGTYAYFVATGALAPGASGRHDNLYVAHQVAGAWTTTFIGELSLEDEKTWSSVSIEGGATRLNGLTSRVSPDGRYFTFMSNKSLTGYDNIDAVSGQPDEEVYVYDASADRLSCASCDPTGARPVGVLDPEVNVNAGIESLLVDRNGIWRNHWLAGSIPAWQEEVTTLYQSRFLSNSGRVFFDSPVALVPQDTNGLEDAYEYEPAGVGGCTSANVTFNETSGGCVSLISSGTSAKESTFMDASEDGDDVFFATASKLTAADYDTSLDVYDAHVCSTSVPCVIVPTSPPACTTGDSCKPSPAPQPETFGPTASATFSGAGNVVPSTAASPPKSLTNKQKRTRAVAACRKKKDKKRRALCERQAEKRYPEKQSGKGGAKKKGKG